MELLRAKVKTLFYVLVFNSSSIGSIEPGDCLSKLLLLARCTTTSSRVRILCPCTIGGNGVKDYLLFSCSAVPGAGMLTEQPQGAAAFNPVPGLGMPAIPFPQWPAACPQSVPQAAHTVPTEQPNVQILPESSDQLVTETTG